MTMMSIKSFVQSASYETHAATPERFQAFQTQLLRKLDAIAGTGVGASPQQQLFPGSGQDRDISTRFTSCAPSKTPERPFPTFEDLIGDTPMLDLSCLLEPATRARGVRVLAKAEFLNPGMSVKDRIIRHIFDRAEEQGQLVPGSVVVAASSGNTGAATAMMCAMRGYKAIITTSPKCSEEKMASIRSYGAQLLVSESGLSEKDAGHYMNMANTMVNTHNAARADAGVTTSSSVSSPSSPTATKAQVPWFNVNQYDNLNNPEAHFSTLGPEIWRQTVAGGASVTHFVAAGSTGGTVSGTGRYLKQVASDLVRAKGNVKEPDEEQKAAAEGPTQGSDSEKQKCRGVKVILADPVGSVFQETWRNLQQGNVAKEGNASMTTTTTTVTATATAIATPATATKEQKSKKFLVEGVGKGAVPGCMDLGVIDAVVPVSDKQAFGMCHRLARETGLLVGGSAGLNVYAALQVAEELEGEEGKNATVVTVLPDSGVKYLSKIYNNQWLAQHQLPVMPVAAVASQ